MEILAPVGGEQQLEAAVRAGADAVYLGTKSFNARRGASNFDSEALKRAVAYCHARGVRVHVTVNTLVTDSELEAVYREIETIGDSGADAVIIQDLAVAELFKRHLPDMPRHASTQMTVHNTAGARAAKELGFSRAVLARELSLTEISEIAAGSEIELECFVHGALCMSVSGQCTLSSMLGGRSGNRGMCAQPCRLNFRVGDSEYALSLKDMSFIERIDELCAAGVCSLKIEGRMKRPEYVAASVNACRRALGGEKPDMELLEKVFSRGGFTDGYLTGRRGADMFGHRTREDAQESAKVLGSIAELYRRERQSVPVDMTLTVRQGQAAELYATDGEHSVTVTGDIPEKVVKSPLEPRSALEKTGGTPFYLRELHSDAEAGYTVKLNPMRRQALDALLAEREKVTPVPFAGGFTAPAGRKSRCGKTAVRVRFEKAEQIFTCPEAEYIYLPVGEINADIIRRFGGRLIGELPRLVFPGSEDELSSLIGHLRAEGLEKVCAGNIGTVCLAKRAGCRVFGSFDLNILNTEALMQYEAMGIEDTLLSYEISMKDAASLGGSIPRGIIGYGYLPLMLYRSCPIRAAVGCAACSASSAAGRPQKLCDRTGTEFEVLCSGKKYSSLLNSVPLYIGDRNVRGIDFVMLYYTTESRGECARVYDIFRAGEPWEGERTSGLYYRKLI